MVRFPQPFVPAVLVGALALVSGVLAACGSSPGPTATPVAVPPTQTPNPNAVQVFVASTDTAVGRNRLAFAVIDASGVVTASDIDVNVHPSRSGAPKTTLSPTFRPWPDEGTAAGLYSDYVELDEAGQWVIEVHLPGNANVDGRVGIATFNVQEQSITPALGTLPPASETKTVQSAADIRDITSAPAPDPDLYQITIKDAMASGKPSVVTFGTPAFCTTRTCGPQVEVVSGLQDRFAGQANFIHVEIFDNPREAAEDLRKARVAPSVEQWKLPSEPWTFILDKDGKVAAKFEGFTNEEELALALQPLLQP